MVGPHVVHWSVLRLPGAPALVLGRVAAALGLVVLALPAGPVVAAPSGPSPPAAAAAEDPLAAVQAVLDARSEAVRRGKADAFMATVDPAAPQGFRDAQARQFQGLRSLPLASFSLRARTEDTGDLGAVAAGRYGGARVFLPETRQVFRLDGYDDRDTVDELWLTFVQRSGRWYVGGDTDLEGIGMETDRQLWDFGPVRAVRSDHLVVLSHPDQAERAAALAAMAEEALGAFAAVWDQPWSGRLPLVLPGSVDVLERLLESTVDLDKFVAFAGYGAVRDEGYASTAPRIFIQDARLARYPRPEQVTTLMHELAHVASAPLSGPFVPGWVHEGLADWAATGRRVGERRPEGGDNRLPRDFELSTGPAASIVRSYRESRAAMSLLAARRGNAAPTALFRALGEIRVAPGSVDHHVDDALRRTTGMTLGELEAGWAERRTG